MNEKSKLIGTGLSGLVGSRLSSIAKDIFVLKNIDVTEGIDITNRLQLTETLEHHADAVALVHFAAFTDVSRAHVENGDKDGACYRINVVGTQNIAGACAEHGIHLIHVSTDFVFDGSKDEEYTELDTPNPIEWYGRTKLLAEEAATSTDSWTIVRIAFPYVAGPAPRPDLVRRIHRKLAEGTEVHLFTDQVITPTFADDIVKGIVVLAQIRPAGEIFHLVGSSSLSPFELGQGIADTFGLDNGLVRPSSLAEYLKADPRPRQRSLRVSNAKWTAFAVDNGLEKPLSIETGLDIVRREMSEDPAS